MDVTQAHDGLLGVTGFVTPFWFCCAVAKPSRAEAFGFCEYFLAQPKLPDREPVSSAGIFSTRCALRLTREDRASPIRGLWHLRIKLSIAATVRNENTWLGHPTRLDNALKYRKRGKSRGSPCVIAGLVPAISIRRAQCADYRDGRDKPWTSPAMTAIPISWRTHARRRDQGVKSARSSSIGRAAIAACCHLTENVLIPALA
jgi:hypothetical protein